MYVCIINYVWHVTTSRTAKELDISFVCVSTSSLSVGADFDRDILRGQKMLERSYVDGVPGRRVDLQKQLTMLPRQIYNSK